MLEKANISQHRLGCGQRQPTDAATLAAELVRFLRHKAKHGDIGPVYLMSPPGDIDMAWHTAVLETAFYQRLLLDLGLPMMHHSALQRGGEAGRLRRLRCTFSATVNDDPDQQLPAASAWSEPAPGSMIRTFRTTSNMTFYACLPLATPRGEVEELLVDLYDLLPGTYTEEESSNSQPVYPNMYVEVLGLDRFIKVAANVLGRVSELAARVKGSRSRAWSSSMAERSLMIPSPWLTTAFLQSLW